MPGNTPLALTKRQEPPFNAGELTGVKVVLKHTGHIFTVSGKTAELTAQLDDTRAPIGTPRTIVASGETISNARQRVGHPLAIARQPQAAAHIEPAGPCNHALKHVAEPEHPFRDIQNGHDRS